MNASAGAVARQAAELPAASGIVDAAICASEAAVAAADDALLRVIDDRLAAAAGVAGNRLACYEGCAVCCFGPFPITWADALRLRRGLRELAPEQAARIRARAAAAVETLARAFPGDVSSGALDPATLREESFAARFADLPCPALDPDSGGCTLYAWRPVACRIYGPPVRIAGGDLPPCPLCFKGCAAEEVETCRAHIEPGGLEHRLAGAMEAAMFSSGERIAGIRSAPGDHGRTGAAPAHSYTVAAFALAPARDAAAGSGG